MVRWASGGGENAPIDEATPIMHPLRMELAPHARLGRRMSTSIAIFVLLVFHISMIAVGSLNWTAPCEGSLPQFLIFYGAVGLLFVYLLFREWLYYAQLSSLPSMTNLVLLILFYVLLCVAGGLLTDSTIRFRDSCGEAAPLLYRWCFAAVLFFCIITFLFILVPTIRVVSRCLLAPIALCIISCVETVGIDVELGDVEHADDGAAGVRLRANQQPSISGGRGGGKQGHDPASYSGKALNQSGTDGGSDYQQNRSTAYGTSTGIGGVGADGRSTCAGGRGSGGSGGHGRQAGGFSHICASCPLGLCMVGFTQIVMAPGCIVPGRSLIALFVNTAALIWFFMYVLYELYTNWEVVCPTRDPGTRFQNSIVDWLAAGAPVPTPLLHASCAQSDSMLHTMRRRDQRAHPEAPV